jgi:hypothetical protein
VKNCNFYFRMRDFTNNSHGLQDKALETNKNT